MDITDSLRGRLAAAILALLGVAALVISTLWWTRGTAELPRSAEVSAAQADSADASRARPFDVTEDDMSQQLYQEKTAAHAEPLPSQF